MRRVSIFVVSVLIVTNALAQQTDVSNETIERAKAYDFSPFLYNNEKYGATGVFDSTYGRLQIRFETVSKDKDNALVYRVTGASRHMKQVTPFTGMIQVKNITKMNGTLDDMLRAMPGIQVEDSRVKEGDQKNDFVVVSATFLLREDSTQKYSGMFDGEVRFALRLTPDGSLSNDWNRGESNYFRNFVYRGEWTAFGGGFSAPVAWADGRIPVGVGVDVGQREFQVAPKFEKYGWKRNDNGDYIDNPEYWWRVKN